MSISPGQRVQTPFGKGAVLELRNRKTAVVQIGERAISISVDDIRPIIDSKHTTTTARSRRRPPASATDPPAEDNVVRTVSVDLHGLTVDDALDALMRTLDRALSHDVSAVHVVHGRSGTRLRRAVHARLRELPFVRNYRLAPRNDGVTIVQL
jgi:dsDNA-specific endonuclease/ATPase MutS2